MNRSGLRIVSVFFIFCATAFSVGILHAVESTFTVSADVISQDNAAPSIPANLNATPASSNQIDLTWNASTDNTSVAGYRVYREGVIIATTTTTSYSDISLFPSTLYSYNVDAFDAALNFSSISATASATTLPVPAANGDDERPRRFAQTKHGQGTSIPFEVHVHAYANYAVLTWNTELYTRANVYWGETQDYEGGVISGVIYQKNHIVKIENLRPGTMYAYKVALESNDGILSVADGTFVTTEDVVINPPQSAILKYQIADSAIKLSWTMQSEGIQQVRLVRSDKFFPVDPYDGKVLYQGTRENEYNDTAVESGKIYYYALFVIDENEMYSAPSVVKAQLGLGEKSVFSGIPYSSSYEEALKDVGLEDFDFVQKGMKLSFSDSGLKLFTGASAEVHIDAEKIPLGIKTIGITFTPTETHAQPATFLLTYSKEKDKYIGIIPSLDAGETYEVEIAIFDTFNNKVKTIRIVAYTDVTFQSADTPNIFIQALYIIRDHYIALIIALLLGFILGFMARRL